MERRFDVRCRLALILVLPLVTTLGCGTAAAPTGTPTVIEQAGSGSVRLAPFVSTGSYRVDLEYECSPGLSAVTITAYGANGTPAETLLMASPASGTSVTTYGTVPGRITLEIGTLNCTWHVRVTT